MLFIDSFYMFLGQLVVFLAILIVQMVKRRFHNALFPVAHI